MRLLKSNLPIGFIFSAPTPKIYVGEKIWKRNNIETPAHIDFGKKIEAGFYTINDLSRDTINPPIPGRNSCFLISSGTHDLLITVDEQRILGRFTEGNHLEWIDIL